MSASGGFERTMSANLHDRKRAWDFAHKLLSIVKVIPELEGKQLLVVKTEEICKAMGATEKAKLEEVQRFVFEVIAFMKGYGMYIACGCGYLSLMVCLEQGHESLIANRDTTAFVPDAIDGYFERAVLALRDGDKDTVAEICDREK
jgi:hypothetical protein